jgi:hypothetical protein
MYGVYLKQVALLRAQAADAYRRSLEAEPTEVNSLYKVTWAFYGQASK